MLFNAELVSLYLCFTLAASSVLAAPTPMHPVGRFGARDIISAPARRLASPDSASVMPRYGAVPVDWLASLPTYEPTQLSGPSPDAQVRRRETAPLTASFQDEMASFDEEDVQAMQQQMQQEMVQATHSAQQKAAASRRRQDSLYQFVTDNSRFGWMGVGNVLSSDVRQFRRQDAGRLWELGFGGDALWHEYRDTDADAWWMSGPPNMGGLRFGAGGDSTNAGHLPRAQEARHDVGGLQFGQTADFGRRWSWPSGEPSLSTLRFGAGGDMGTLSGSAY